MRLMPPGYSLSPRWEPGAYAARLGYCQSPRRGFCGRFAFLFPGAYAARLLPVAPLGLLGLSVERWLSVLSTNLAGSGARWSLFQIIQHFTEGISKYL